MTNTSGKWKLWTRSWQLSFHVAVCASHKGSNCFMQLPSTGNTSINTARLKETHEATANTTLTIQQYQAINMARLVVVTSKFLAVAGLGLLSSSALTISYTVFPSLLSLPSPSDAVPVFYKLKQHVAAAHHLLAIATGVFTTTAFVASPRFARHPFLIYMGLSAGVGLFGIPKLMKTQGLDCLDEMELAEEGRGRTGPSMRLNGEIVKEAVESLQRSLRWQSLLWGAGWAMGTIGLWGDGF